MALRKPKLKTDKQKVQILIRALRPLSAAGDKIADCGKNLNEIKAGRMTLKHQVLSDPRNQLALIALRAVGEIGVKDAVAAFEAMRKIADDKRTVIADAVRKPVSTAKFFPQHEVDEDRVLALIDHIRKGGKVPPVVVVEYADGEEPKYMVLFGHHRMYAHQRLHRDADAWVVSGADFDELCTLVERAEDHIQCGDWVAPEVELYF